MTKNLSIAVLIPCWLCDSGYRVPGGKRTFIEEGVLSKRDNTSLYCLCEYDQLYLKYDNTFGSPFDFRNRHSP